MEIDVVIEVSKQNDILVPRLLPLGTAIAGSGETAIRWSLITVNQHNDKQATFGSPGVEVMSPIPTGIRFASTFGSSETEWVIEIDNQMSSASAAVNVQYNLNYLFDGVAHTDDPIIVVTPEPIGPSAVTLPASLLDERGEGGVSP